MQLMTARLCLDCDEVHDAQQCPVCASEVFTYMTRWVPAPERRLRPRPTTSPQADAYRHLTSGEPARSTTRRLWTQGVVGLTAVSLIGWLWRRTGDRPATDRGGSTASNPARD
jgi:hypothetical protein